MGKPRKRKSPDQAYTTVRDRCRKLFKLTPIQACFAWRQVVERESGKASYEAALAERGKTTKSPEVQASKMLRLTKIQEAMAWLRQELGITAAESAEEFDAAEERARSIRFLRSIRDGGFSKFLGGGLEVDEEAWVSLPDAVKDLFQELEVGIVFDDEGNERRVITRFKLADRMKAQGMLIELFGLKKQDPAILELLAKLEGFAAAKRAKG